MKAGITQDRLITDNRVQASPTGAEKHLIWIRWVLMALWVGVCLFTLNYNGPFYDESTYIVAGTRNIQGFGISDGYFVWFNGSLIWPTLAAFGYRYLGLFGSRAIAVLLAAIGAVSVIMAAENLFGIKASFWTAVALILNAPLMILARLGVYDLPAIAGMSIALWAISQVSRYDNRFWLIIAAITYNFGVLGKYPMAIMIVPLIGVLLTTRGHKALLDVTAFLFVTIAIALIYVMPMREQFQAILDWQSANIIRSNVTQGMIAIAIAYDSAIYFILALIITIYYRSTLKLSWILLFTMTIWPLYHLWQNSSISMSKHLVQGFMYSAPLVGLFFSAIWSAHRHYVLARISVILILLGLLAYQVSSVSRANAAWPDIRPAASYLVENVQPGDKLLASEAWPYTMYLYTQQRIDSPWDIFDAYRVRHGEAGSDLCAYDWFIDSNGSFKWSEDVHGQITACGTFTRVFTVISPVIGIGSDLRFVEYNVTTTIWRNMGK